MKQLRILWLGVFYASAVAYLISSYLILLRDPFFLERISITLANPGFESWALQLAQVIKINFISLVAITISIFGLITSYYRLLKLKYIPSILSLIAILLPFFISFPSLSTDVFDYNNNNRLFFIHGTNPFIFPANIHPDDSEIYYGSWINRPSIYPTVTFATGTLVYFVFGANPLASLWGFKLINVALYIITYLLAKKWGVKREHLSVFFPNPLVLVELIGNAHNDFLMGFWFFVCLFLLRENQFFKAGIFLGLGFLSKISVVLIAPFLFFQLLQNNKVKELILFNSSLIVTITIGLISLGEASLYLLKNFTSQTDIYERSIPTIIRWSYLTFSNTSNLVDANSFQKMTALIFLSIFLFLLLKLNKSFNLVQLSLWSIIIYLLFFSPMLKSWYLAWILPSLLLFSPNRLTYLAVLFSATMMITYPVHYLSLYLQPTNFIWQIIQYCVMSLPLVLAWKFSPRWYTFATTIKKS